VSAEPGPGVLIAVVALVVLAVAASAAGRLRTGRAVVVAALRAVGQLAAVSLVIAVVLQHLWSSLLFAVAMFAVAVAATARRVGAPRRWPWAAAAMAAGVLPVLVVIFASRAVPFTGPTVVPFAGIVTGGAMTAHSLAGRRVFAALREHRDTYEAALALGLPPRAAVDVVARHLLPEALVPGLDQTRTVGLVTLPGAFVGVLLGGGTPAQAGAAQVVVLVGLLAAQALTVVTGYRLVRTGRLVPDDLAAGVRSWRPRARSRTWYRAPRQRE
jgi:putative ABC transport system permease protein